MTPLLLTLENFIGIRSGLKRNALVLDLAKPARTGLVAFVGPNGMGKTTVLDSLTPYRLMPFRSGGYSERQFSYYEETFGDARKELIWTHHGNKYRSEILIKGTNKTKTQQATLYFENCDGAWQPYVLPDGQKCDGKAEIYDKAVRAVMGTPEMFFTAAFSRQERRRLCDYDATEMKVLLAELLNLEGLLSMSEQSGKAASYLSAQAEGMAGQVQNLRADEASRADAAARLTAAQADSASAVPARAEARQRVIAGSTAVAEARAQQANLDQVRIERDRLASDKAIIERTYQQRMAQLQQDEVRIHADAAATDIRRQLTAVDGRLAGLSAQMARLTASLQSAPKVEAVDAQLAELERTQVAGRVVMRALEADVQALATELADLPSLDIKLANFASNGKIAKASFEADTLRAGLVSQVPCAGMDISSACPLLKGAHAAADTAAALAVQVSKLRADWNETNTKSAALKLKRPALLAAKEALVAATANVDAITDEAIIWRGKKAQAEAVIETRRSLDECSAGQVAAEGEHRALGLELDRRAVDTDARQAEVKRLSDDAAASRSSHLARVDAALLALPPEAGVNQVLATAEGLLATAEADLAAAEQRIATSQQSVATLSARIEILDEKIGANAALAAKADDMAADVGYWRLLQKALGKDGIVALTIDDAGPSLSSITNELLTECYGPRFSIRFDTQSVKKDGTVKEDFDIRVFDAEAGDDKSLSKTSGGERLWINEAITSAIGLYLAKSTGASYETRYSDESDGALDPERKQMFMRMKRKVLQLGGYTSEFYITHSPELWGMADSVIDFRELRQ